MSVASVKGLGTWIALAVHTYICLLISHSTGIHPSAGNGNFTIPLSQNFRRVVATEASSGCKALSAG